MKKTIKIGIITSKGGHLVETLQLSELVRQYTRFWVTFSGEDATEYLQKEHTYYAYFPESRNIINLCRNTLLAIKILYTERPKVLISCGAGIAIPFFVIGKYIFKTKLIYIESYDFVSYPSMTGRLLYTIVDLFLIQHKIQRSWYPSAIFWGSLL